MLNGKTALVTGGSRGIGAAIVRRLGAAGAHVAINYAGNQAAAQALADDTSAWTMNAFPPLAMMSSANACAAAWLPA